MSAAENFPAFNAAVAELTLKVQSLIADLTEGQINLGPEVAAALQQLAAANTAAQNAVAAAATATQAAQAVQDLEAAFNAAIGTVATLTTNVGTLTTDVNSAKAQVIESQAAVEEALASIEGLSGNLAKIVQVAPAGVTPAAQAASTINTGKSVTRGALLLLGVKCTTSTPLQMYDLLIKVGAVTVYDARGILGNLSDSFSSFSVAAGEISIVLTNNGSAPATLTPVVMFSELTIV